MYPINQSRGRLEAYLLNTIYEPKTTSFETVKFTLSNFPKIIRESPVIKQQEVYATNMSPSRKGDEWTIVCSSFMTCLPEASKEALGV
jgi:hypothetical protein